MQFGLFCSKNVLLQKILETRSQDLVREMVTNHLDAIDAASFSDQLDILKCVITTCVQSVCLELEESYSIISEIDNLQFGSVNINDHDVILRLKAMFDRIRRLCFDQHYALEILFDTHYYMQKALGIKRPQNVVKKQVEVSTTYLLQKIVDKLLADSKFSKAGAPWMTLSPGHVSGILKVTNQDDFFNLPDNNTPLIVLAQNLVGDEHIPDNVQAIIVGEDLPLTSNLVTRARKQHCLFACTSDYNQFMGLRKELDVVREGDFVRCTITHSGAVCICPANGDNKDDKNVERIATEFSSVMSTAASEFSNELPAVIVENVEDLGGNYLVPIQKAEASTCGIQAHRLALVHSFASCSDSLCTTPKTVLVPFEEFTKQAQKEDKVLTQILETISDRPTAARDFVLNTFEVPQELVNEITSVFAGATNISFSPSAKHQVLTKPTKLLVSE